MTSHREEIRSEMLDLIERFSDLHVSAQDQQVNDIEQVELYIESYKKLIKSVKEIMEPENPPKKLQAILYNIMEETLSVLETKRQQLIKFRS